MRLRRLHRAFLTFTGGVVFGAASLCVFNATPAPLAHAQPTPTSSDRELEKLRGEVEHLKNVVPDQSHAMQDVEYHFANLWFAAQESNWPLAQFYLDETRTHLRWAVRIIPVRKDNAGREVKLEDILQAVESSALKQLDEAVKAKDREKFTTDYEFMLTNCYACHKAADKPYLRPKLPERPATTIINVNPHATWPE